MADDGFVGKDDGSNWGVEGGCDSTGNAAAEKGNCVSSVEGKSLSEA